MKFIYNNYWWMMIVIFNILSNNNNIYFSCKYILSKPAVHFVASKNTFELSLVVEC